MSADSLTHQFQPTPFTCVHTCIAMVLGCPVQDVIDEIGHPNGLDGRKLLDALDYFDLMHAMTAFGALWTGWQFVVVPSLNITGGAHQILVHFDAGVYRVLDPSPKIRYKEDGSDLRTWGEVVLVKPPKR